MMRKSWITFKPPQMMKFRDISNNMKVVLNKFCSPQLAADVTTLSKRHCASSKPSLKPLYRKKEIISKRKNVQHENLHSFKIKM
jgi:hypothetical protein